MSQRSFRNTRGIQERVNRIELLLSLLRPVQWQLKISTLLFNDGVVSTDGG